MRRNVLLRRSLPVLVLAVSLASCAKPAPPRNSRVAVTVAKAESRVVPFTLSAPGTVESIRSASVRAQVGGIVERVAFAEGATVSEGQLLFQIDPRPFAAALETARGTYSRDRANFLAALANATRGRELLKQQLIAPQELEQLEAASEALRASVAADSGAMLRAKLDLANASVRAPIGGHTGEWLVHEGDLVRANASDQPLVTIHQLQPIRVRFALPGSTLEALRMHDGKGAVVRVRGMDSDSVLATGALVFLDHAVDEASGTVLAKGEFANAKGTLWPGEAVRVELELAAEKVKCAVPAAAVTLGQQGPFVFVMQADSTVKMQPIKLVRDAGEWSVVRSGLEPGETVVTDGQFRLNNGAKVIVRPAAPPLGAGAPGKPVTRGTAK